MMWYTVIAIILSAITTLSLSVAIHEQAHVKRANMLGYKANISFERVKKRGFALVTSWKAKGCTDKEEASIISWGITLGFIPIIFYMLLVDLVTIWAALWVVTSYALFCRKDWLRLTELRGENEDRL